MMNPMRRLIKWLMAPLMPIRFFAVEASEDNYVGTDEDGNSYYVDDDGAISMYDADGNEVSTNTSGGPAGDESNWTDEGGYTYDTDTDSNFTFDESGNLIDADTGKQVDTSDWGNVIGVEDGNGKTVAGYTYNEATGKYENQAGRGYTNDQLNATLHNAYGGDASAKIADNIASVMGNTLNAQNTKAMQTLIENGGGETLRQAMSNAADAAKSGQKDTGLNVMVGVLTGTIPPNSTTREAQAIAEISNRVQNGESLKDAFYGVCDQYGYTANAQMNTMLRDSALNTAFMVAGPIIGAAGRAMAASKVSKTLNFASQFLDKAAKLGKGKVNLASLGINKTMGASKVAGVGSKLVTNALNMMDKADKTGAVISAVQLAGQLGIGVDEAQVLVDAYNETKAEAGNTNYYDSIATHNNPKEAEKPTAEDTLSTAAKAAETTKSAPTERAKTTVDIEKNNPTTSALGEAAKGEVKLPTGADLDPWGGNNPFAPGNRTPEKEDPNAGRDRGFDDESSDDSGDDTLETTVQDAPTGGVGTDTFVNTNDDTRKGWGLGEEDPNRANYDIDKWNRGMERVSTDVVSDAKLKNFITKTFKDDPVLIKTVKIMKSK